MTESELAPTPQPPQKILIIDPSKTARDKAAALVKQLGHEAKLASDPFEAHALVDGASMVIATHPTSADIYPRLRAAGIPLVAAFPARQEHAFELAARLGADGFVVRPYKKDALQVALYSAFSSRLLRERALRAELALADAHGVPRADDQAGLLHADVFKTLLPLEIRRARRHGYPISICVVALDPLPSGQAHTPQLVVACQPLIRSAVRDVDLAVRYGDGRFLVFLPHTDARGAEAVGRRIVTGIRGTRFKSGGVTLMLTASVGIASLKPGKTPSFARLIRDAHTAVRAAQLKGGDRAIVR